MVSSKGFEVQMWLADGLDGPRIATVHKKIGPQKSVRLYFDTPIKLRANRVYSAYVNIVGSELSYFGVQGQSVVMVEIPNSKNSLTVRFLCNPHSKNGTGTVAGQIPELLFYSPLNLAELP